MVPFSRRIVGEFSITIYTNGSYIFTESEESFMDTPEVEVADTVGAGDSFIATFMASILKGSSIREAHELAVKVSAYVCTQFGGMCDITAILRTRILRSLLPEAGRQFP